MSLGLVRNVFETALDMSRELGVDAARHTKWQHILQHLSDFPTQQRNGKTVFRYTEKGLAWFASNSCGVQHIYPAGSIGLDRLLKNKHQAVSPAVRRLGKRSIFDDR